MAVQSGLVPMGDANHFTILFPIRPGETEFQVSYSLPYPGNTFTFQPRPVRPTDNVVVMMPKSMTFKPGVSTPYSPVTEELGAQTYVARNAQPSQPLDFTVSGTGELPRDPAPGQTGGQTGGQANAQPVDTGTANTSTTQDPNTDTRPGGGLGVPVDKDAVRDPWTKYRWWIIGGMALLLAAAAGVMLRQPASGTASQVRLGPSGALQVLRDELFAVETDRLEGRLSEAQYTELKAAFDVVLRRTLARGSASGGVGHEADA